MRKEILLLLTASFFWGTSFPFIKYSLQNVPPIELLLLRFGLSSLMIFIFLALGYAKVKFYSKEILLLGFTNALGFLFQFLGQKFTSASVAPLIIHTNLVIVVLLSWILLKERITGKTIIAVILASAGVFILTTKLNFSNLSFSSYRGELLLLLAAISWAFFIIFSRKYERQVASPQATFGVLLWTFFFQTPLFLISRTNFSFSALLKGGYLAVFCTIIPYLLYFQAIKKLRAVSTNIILTAEIFFAILLSIIFLSERPDFSFGLGGALIMLAIYLLFLDERAGYHKQKEEI